MTATRRAMLFTAWAVLGRVVSYGALYAFRSLIHIT